MANIYYVLNVRNWSLMLLHKMEENDNGSILNYSRVGFGSLIMVYMLAPLIRLGFHGIPSLGIGSRWTLVIFLCLLVAWSRLYAVGEGDCHGNEAMDLLFSQHFCLFVCLLLGHTYYPSNCFVVVGERAMGRCGICSMTTSHWIALALQ